MARLDNINFDSCLGSGTYGCVYSTKDLQFAYKEFENLDEDDCFGDTILTEISMMNTLKDVPVVQKVDNIIYQKDQSGFFMKLYRTSVDNEIKQQINMSKKMKINYTKHVLYGLLVGLYYAHQRLIIHCDIKPSNIVINNEREIALIDWGLAIGDKYNEENILPTQTLWYRAPEVLLEDSHYGPKIDIWSAGLVCYFILFNRVMFPGDSPIDQLYKIFRVFGTPNETTWPCVTSLYDFVSFPIFTGTGLPTTDNFLLDDLLQNMLQLNPANRYTAEQALNHSFFDDLRDDVFYEIPKIYSVQLIPSLSMNIANIDINKRKESLLVLRDIYQNDNLSISNFFLSLEILDHILSLNNVIEYADDATLLALSSAYLASMFNINNKYDSDHVDYSLIELYIEQFPNINSLDLCNLSYNIFKILEYNLYRQHFGLYLNIISDYVGDYPNKQDVTDVIFGYIQNPEYFYYDKSIVIAAAYYSLDSTINLQDFITHFRLSHDSVNLITKLSLQL